LRSASRPKARYRAARPKAVRATDQVIEMRSLFDVVQASEPVNGQCARTAAGNDCAPGAGPCGHRRGRSPGGGCACATSSSRRQEDIFARPPSSAGRRVRSGGKISSGADRPVRRRWILLSVRVIENIRIPDVCRSGAVEDRFARYLSFCLQLDLGVNGENRTAGSVASRKLLQATTGLSISCVWAYT